MQLTDKRILLGISGGIAAYKAPALIRLLTKLGAEVQVVMTHSAHQFVTPTALQAVSGNPVRDDLWDEAAEASMGHIELARWADLILIAPATADLMARLAHGFANDLLTTLCLATDANIMLAPAMNRLMWSNDATQDNLELLKNRDVHILGPDSGDQACGETGLGRMLEPEDIVDVVVKELSTDLEETRSLRFAGPLVGKHIVITAGPTREAIDPVRFLSNHSSGKMGFALASAAQAQGAIVTLIAGPVSLPTPHDVKRIDVMSAVDMYEKVMEALDECDIFIGTAAVADYRPAQRQDQKIKKSSDNSDSLVVTMERNPDILASVAAQHPRPVCIGFAAETENLLENARDKLARKNLDLIVANLVGNGRTFGKDETELHVFWPGGDEVIAKTTKHAASIRLVKIISHFVQQNFAETLVHEGNIPD
ncbi:MAG: bifunctional phosphopantothenoylcysteine decarboxylase/phosphopantothenate--cysteine ligase CoaBC [Gammaproteobacteria bacterium]|nr:bifunctional phosphopantothenoylcysteine decarboxylase/phosphopantothenate--cysteine ligase CoaBC [Gammaproteobacteria bacterium]NNC98466.1 bifunctional phosphopantothenoylcysteine decarboxylase/phosphopantothenate--cysteine ligase CoaBC [Gammaproteobacteria bacterium]NNM14773.1 bifunctional phosphopantothenoylcysteine decarboxylase/phosphopantothenate--cysteine ligase CoaBC [Gammaproteobacteria bacterium]